MKNTRIYLSLLLVTFLIGASQLRLEAAHIVGGDVTYECNGLDTLADGTVMIDLSIEFNMYKDEFFGAGFNDPAEFGLYLFNGSTYQWIRTLDEGIDDTGSVALDTDNPCVIYPPQLGVLFARYTFDLAPLPILTGANERYAIVWQRCCRNASITNIVSPESTGAAFIVEITSQAMAICNHSPKFNNFPPVVICGGQPIDFDHSASDIEGHQVFYEFCAPLQAGGQEGGNGMGGDPTSCNGVTPSPENCRPPYDEVTFLLPNFSPTNPMAGNPQIMIDSQTGLITGTPNVNGQYVVGVCAREVFNGQIMTVIRRDFQFNVVTCEVAVTADIDPQGSAVIEPVTQMVNGQPVTTPTIVSCGEDEITFIHAGDTDDIETYYWEAQIAGNTFTANTQEAVFAFPGPGEYGVLLITNEGLTCEARDSFPVLIHPNLFPDFEFAYDTCVAGPVIFDDLSTLETVDQSIVEWFWDFDGLGTDIDQNPDFTFPQPGDHEVALTITDNNGCTETNTQTVNWFPAPPFIFVSPNLFEGCVPSEVFFNNLSTPIDTTYDITWEFGDGETSSEISPTHVYQETGVFDVYLNIVSPIGCQIDSFYPSYITISDKPEADFTFTPEEPSVFNMTVDFNNSSIGAESYQWDFSDQSNSTKENPTHTFRDTGVYLVTLIAKHMSGCTDTFTRLIDIEPIITFHMPNAFTPNGDATNDILIGNGFYDGMREFKYSVWNRWGEKIFESDDPYVGWNGRKNNNGRDSPAGVYVYDVTYVDPRGMPQSLRGHATLIR